VTSWCVVQWQGSVTYSVVLDGCSLLMKYCTPSLPPPLQFCSSHFPPCCPWCRWRRCLPVVVALEFGIFNTDIGAVAKRLFVVNRTVADYCISEGIAMWCCLLLWQPVDAVLVNLRTLYCEQDVLMCLLRATLPCPIMLLGCVLL
jgi:hypothetical protein